MPEQINNIVEIFGKIWRGIAESGFFLRAWETVQNWMETLNSWLMANADISLKDIFDAFVSLFIWVFKLILEISRWIIELLEKTNV